MDVCAAIHQGPNSTGRLRHFALLLQRQAIASIVRLRSWCWRYAPIKGASTAYCLSIGTPTTRRSYRR